MLDQEVRRWTAMDAADLYDIRRWGKGYFSVAESGHVLVHPTKDPNRFIDLKQFVDGLQLRGIDLPILIRFAGILKHRLCEIHDAFQSSINEHKYTGATAASIRSKSISSAKWSKRCCGSASRFSSGSRPAASPSCWPSSP